MEKKILKMRLLNLTWSHSIALALRVKKMALCSVKLAKISSVIKDYPFYFKFLNFNSEMSSSQVITQPQRNVSAINKRGSDWTCPTDIGQNTCSRNGWKNDTVIGNWSYWIIKRCPWRKMGTQRRDKNTVYIKSVWKNRPKKHKSICSKKLKGLNNFI